jgi:phosphoribosyl-AMP cyclohydrolase
MGSEIAGHDRTDSAIAFDDRGLVACVVQDWASGEVLTLAYMNALAPLRTQQSNERCRGRHGDGGALGSKLYCPSH